MKIDEYCQIIEDELEGSETIVDTITKKAADNYLLPYDIIIIKTVEDKTFAFTVKVGKSILDDHVTNRRILQNRIEVIKIRWNSMLDSINQGN